MKFFLSPYANKMIQISCKSAQSDLCLCCLLLRSYVKCILRSYVKCILATPHVYAPNFEKVGGAYWFRLVRMYVRTYVCMYVCIHVRDIVLKLHVWIPHGKIADAYFWFSLNYLPMSNYGPLTNKGMKFCKCHISKSIIARNLKLVSADRG